MARRKKVQLIDLSAAIEQLMKEYGEDVYEVVGESVEEVTDQATDKLKAVNHWANEGSGEYAGSWVNNDKLKSRIHRTKVVHNQEHYRLTHLLEKGHVVRNGTNRNNGKKRTGKYPHIAPVNDWAGEELPKVFKKKVESL